MRSDAEVREPSALLTPAQSFPRATFTWWQFTPSRKEARSLLAADSEPSECGAEQLSTSVEAGGRSGSLNQALPAGQKTFL